MNLGLKLYFQENKPLYIQVSDSIVNSIRLGKLSKGDKVPSINQLSVEYLLSRDTVEKAYKDLMKKGIIQSVIGKGYYINRVDVQKNLRVLVIFNKLSNYKRQLYDSVIQTLGPEATVDLSVHHSNADLLNNIICSNIGSYDYYLIAYHFYCDINKAIESIRRLPQNRVILLDKKLPDDYGGYVAVYQDYERDIYQALTNGIEMLKKYNRLFLSFPTLSNYPKEIVKGFRLFCISNSFKYDVIRDIEPLHDLQIGDAYVVIEETDLANLIKICRQKGLQVGKDIGIISYNDTPLKEILLDGITVFSTDHEAMGRTAASLILGRKLENVKNPFSLIKRNSL